MGEGQPPTPSSQWRARLARAALVVAGLAVAAAVLEVTLRVLEIEVRSAHSIAGFTVHDPVLGWRLAPSRQTIFEDARFSVRVSHNAEGLRDRHYDYARAPGRRRILVLGDSVVWCWGVEHDDCFTERLEQSLQDTDVINAGVPGYSTAQELLFYEREGRQYHADLVLLVVVPNDPLENTEGRRPRFRLEGGRLTVTNLPVPRRKNRAEEWLRQHSRLFAHALHLPAVARAALHRARAKPDPPPPAAAGLVGEAGDDPLPPGHPFAAFPPTGDEAGWRLTEALAARLAAAVAADGARLAVVLEAMPAPMRRWQMAFWAARGVPCLDLTPALAAATRRGEQIRLADDPHLAVPGQVAMTGEIRRFLEREALLGPEMPGPGRS